MKNDLEIVKEIVANATPDHLLDTMQVGNFRKTRQFEKGYRFTLRILSVAFLENIIKSEIVKDVFFHPSAPPPGTGMDGIASRYRVYVLLN